MTRVERSVARYFTVLAVLALIPVLGSRIARAQISIQDLPAPGSATSDIPQLEMTRLEKGVFDHGSVSAAYHLYVIGGVRGDKTGLAVSAEVDSFPMGSSGGVGPLRAEAPLTRPLAGLGNACAAWRDRVLYVAGGSDSVDGNTPVSNHVEIGLLGRGGVVSSWEESSPWPGPPLTRVAVTVSQGQFYVVGGLEGSGKASHQVYRAPILKDGTLGKWSIEAPLPEGRMGHAVCTAEGRMLVVGGRTGLGKHPSWQVLSTDLGTSGTIAAWSPEPMSLPYALADGAGCPMNGRFVWIGGTKGNEQPFPDLVFTLLRHGHPQRWVTLRLGLLATYGLAAAQDDEGERIYLSGGRASDKSGAGNPGILALAILPESSSNIDTDVLGGTSNKVEPKRMEINKVRIPGDRQSAEPEPHFEPEQEAFQDARKRHRPMLLVVYSSKDKESMKLRKTLFSSARFLELMAGVVLGEVDVVKDPTARSRYDTKKLPLFLVYDADGALKRQDTSARTMKDFAKITLDVQ